MVLIVAMGAFSLDVASWEVSHHQAQVVADSAALAAANCLASTSCTQTTTTGDAATVAGNYASNGVQVTGVTFAGSTVKVTTQKTGNSAFAGLFGIPSLNTTASATASFNTLIGYSFSCVKKGAASCLSMFAGNTYCPSSKPGTDNIGLSLVTNDNGGGSATMTGLYTNAFYYNGANSGSFTASGPSCSSDTMGGRTTFTTTSGTVPYPAVWKQPKTCTYSTATTFSSFPGPGTYCDTGTPASASACSTAAGGGTSGNGIMNITMSSLTAGAYEFVGPCVIINGSNSNVTAISGQPLVYGTSNITTAAKNNALPTCTLNDGSNGSSTILVGNGSSIDASIFDQCGTFEVSGNNPSFTGFVEAWNIIVDKNGGVTGDGPSSTLGAGEQIMPGGDALVG